MKANASLQQVQCVLLFIGMLASPARAYETLQDGDLLVGATKQSGANAGAGVIWQVRNGVKEVFCESEDPAAGTDERSARAFQTPFQIAIERGGLQSVVFLAPVIVSSIESRGILPPGVGGFALFRCFHDGTRADTVGVFPERPLNESELNYVFTTHLRDVVPIKDAAFELLGGPTGSSHEGGLHMARRQVLVIDDRGQDDLPHTLLEEVVVFGAAIIDPDTKQRTGTLILEHPTVEFPDIRPEWRKDTVKVVRSVDLSGNATWRVPDMTIDVLGNTISAVGGRVGIDMDAVHLTLFANLGPLGTVEIKDLRLRTGGLREPPYPSAPFDEGRGPFMDDVGDANAANCPPDPAMKITNLEPTTPFNATTLDVDMNIVLDQTGTPVMSNSTGPHPRLFRWLNADSLLHRPQADDNFFLKSPSCTKQPWMQVEVINPAPTGLFNINTATVLASGNNMIAATQFNKQRVIRVANGNEVVLADGLLHASGLAIYPPQVNLAIPDQLVVRIDSPVDVLVTGPDGKKIGVDPDTGSAVNDYGDDGFDSGPGEPRIYAIANPPMGAFAAQTVGTDTGPFAIHVYYADWTQPTGEHIQTTGETAPGLMSEHSWMLADSGEIAFVATDEVVPVEGDSRDSGGSSLSPWLLVLLSLSVSIRGLVLLRPRVISQCTF